MFMEWVVRLFKNRHVWEGSHWVEVRTVALKDCILTCLSEREVFTGPLEIQDTEPYSHGLKGIELKVYHRQFLSFCLIFLPSAKAGAMHKRELATLGPGDLHG